ncbi:putative AC transposase [Cardamine amara subsp. amara]|uniref:AC transposase n=1 Tax=Cardamine amara subsp. amara TaxID=228776 RepID=A0ABD0Z1I2_CARAN
MDAMFDDAEKSEGAEIIKPELESYLDDIREDRKNPNFKILDWWKTTGSKYKILSLMARDLLAIHVSTIASESAFSTGDWYRDDEEDLNVEELLDELENIESEVETLSIQP